MRGDDVAGDLDDPPIRILLGSGQELVGDIVDRGNLADLAVAVGQSSETVAGSVLLAIDVLIDNLGRNSTRATAAVHDDGQAVRFEHLVEVAAVRLGHVEGRHPIVNEKHLR